MKRFLAPCLLLVSFGLVGWTLFVDNFLGVPLTQGTPSNGQIWKFNSATLKYVLATDSGGAETLSISDLTDVGPMTEASGDILYFDTVWTRLEKGVDGQVLKLAAGLPSWAADAGGAETLASSDLTDFSTAKTGTGTSVVSNTGPTIADAVFSTFISFSDQTANASTAGRLQRNGANLSFHDGTAARDLIMSNDTRLTDARTPTAHATSHQNGGGDEINLAGLSGELADPQPPKAHATDHKHGGADEVATATPGANAIPKADGSNKLASGWLSDVLNLVDLLDVTFTSLANNDILMRIGGSWVNAVSAGDVTWTGSGNTITTVIGALKVTNAMLAGSITGDKISTVPDSVTNVTAATDLTITATGDEVVMGDALRLASLSASPAQVGGMSYDTDDQAFVAKADIGVLIQSGRYSSQVADSSAIASTASETSFDALPTTFPANTLTAGRVIRWVAHYRYSTTGTPTLRLRNKLSGTSTATIADSSNFNAGTGVTNQLMVVHGVLTIRTAGASGTYDCGVTMHNVGANNVATSAGPTSQFGSVTANIDTTQTNQLLDTWQWGTSSASNTVKRVGLVVWVE